MAQSPFRPDPREWLYIPHTFGLYYTLNTNHNNTINPSVNNLLSQSFIQDESPVVHTNDTDINSVPITGEIQHSGPPAA